MLLSQSYEIDAKIKNLSGRLEQYARESNLAYTHINEQIRGENLKHNLSLIISEIALGLIFEDRSVQALESVINEYNTNHGTNLAIRDFEELHWIRYINNEINFPSVIRYSLWNISYEEKEGRKPKIPEGMEDKIRCLQIFYELRFENSVPKIPVKNVVSILKKHKIPTEKIDVSYLTAIGLLKISGKHCEWLGGDHTRYLADEICATIWLSLIDKQDTNSALKKFLKILNACQIWPRSLHKFLNHSIINNLSNEIILLLRKEDDLLASDSELQKVLLDPASYRDRGLAIDFPDYKLNYSSTQSLLESVEYFEWNHREAFDHQTVRSHVNVLINILVSSEAKAHKPFERTLDLFADPTRPYVVLELYELIKRRFPEVIPYMLVRSDIAPIGFELIDKIQINATFLQYSESYNGSYEEALTIKSRFWLEMLDIALELVSLNSTFDAGEYLSRILLDIADKTFTNNSNQRNGQSDHVEFKRRYDEVITRLHTRRVLNRYSVASNQLQPRLIHLKLPELYLFMVAMKKTGLLPHNEYTHLQSGWFDLSIELLRLSEVRIHSEEIYAAQKERIIAEAQNLLNTLLLETEKFYTATYIEIMSYDFVRTTSKVNRNVNVFGFEIIDWGFLYANFHRIGKIDDLHLTIINSIEFNIEESKYDDQNKEQKEKIQLYLMSLMLALLAISKQKKSYEIEGYNVSDLTHKLQIWISDLANQYSTDELPNKRIDVFAERHTFSYNIYSQRLSTLLFKCVNTFDSESQARFIEDFFSGSVDIGRMLEASNIIEWKKLASQISQKIEAIPIDHFIDSSIFTFELQSALIDAANSERHWSLAKPLLEKLQAHFDKVMYTQDHVRDLLVEVDLLLAFKDKDITRLQNIEVPEQEGFDRPRSIQFRQLKQFFIALHYLHTDHNYNGAISILQALSINSPKSIRFALKLFEAKTAKAIKTENIGDLKEAQKEWQTFLDGLSTQEKALLSDYEEAVAANELLHYSVANNVSGFDYSIMQLSDRYIFDEDILPTIFNFYSKNDLADLGYYYLYRSRDYYIRNEIEVPKVIQQLLDDAIDNQALAKFKSNLASIRSLPYGSIPKIIPEALNGKREINEFILFEIISATKVLLDKIHSVKQITHENRYNDLLLATLRLRFPFYGWNIQDQSRVGKSPTDKDAGEIDLLIQSAGNSIAFIEALVLKGNNKKYTQDHIKKCFDYVPYLDRYYVVSYYKGVSSKIDGAWGSYQKNVLATTLPSFATIETGPGFRDLTGTFPDTKHLKIGMTLHKDNSIMYHIMVPLS